MRWGKKGTGTGSAGVRWCRRASLPGNRRRIVVGCRISVESCGGMMDQVCVNQACCSDERGRGGKGSNGWFLWIVRLGVELRERGSIFGRTFWGC